MPNVAAGAVSGGAAGSALGPWGAAAGAVIGGALSWLGGKGAKDTADEAAQREQAASAQGLAAQQAAYQEAQAALQPYALQEQVASTQMMAQMGLAPPPGAGGGAAMGAPTGGDAWGFGAGGAGGAQAQQSGNFNKFLEDVLTEQMVISKRAGYNKKRGLAEGARRTIDLFEGLKREGKLPQGFQMPSMTSLVAQAGQIEDAYGGLKNMERTLSPGVTHEGYTTANIQGFMDRYDIKPQAPAGMGEQPGEALEGEYIPAEAPSPQTAGDIMGRAGVEGLPEGLGEQYYEGIMEDPRTDPELAGYLGLTPESMQVGSEYQQLPAYMKAREAGMEAVNVGAAGSGSLYSGRRGEELRDVGQQVESQYYQDAVRQQQQMMQARRGERGAGLARMGGAYETGRNREQSYYNNYMQMLQGMSQPTATTNIGAMGTSLGRETSANLIGTARGVSDLQIGGAGAQQAAYADIAGGIMRVAPAFLSAP